MESSVMSREEKLETTWAVGYLLCVLGGISTVVDTGMFVIWDIVIDRPIAIVGLGVLGMGVILTFIGDWDSPK